MGEPGEVVDRFANGAHGDVLRKGQGCRCAVDAHQPFGRPDHGVEVSAVDEMKARLQAKPPRLPPNEIFPIEKARIQRVAFDEQVRVGRRIGREALEHIFRGALHVWEGRVRPDLVVAGKLEGQKEDRLALESL